MKEVNLEDFFKLLKIIPEYHYLSYFTIYECYTIQNIHSGVEILWTQGMAAELEILFKGLLVKYDDMLFIPKLRDHQACMYVELYVF